MLLSGINLPMRAMREQVTAALDGSCMWPV
jgi:hypothetical protein